jgi:hypothetical protein
MDDLNPVSILHPRVGAQGDGVTILKAQVKGFNLKGLCLFLDQIII